MNNGPAEYDLRMKSQVSFDDQSAINRSENPTPVAEQMDPEVDKLK